MRAYRRRLALDLCRLRYFCAWATLRRLSICGRWLQAGPQINGCKPALLHYLGRDHLVALQRYFRRWTDVEVFLGLPCGAPGQPPGDHKSSAAGIAVR